MLADDEARRSVERILEQAKADVRNLLDTNRHLVVALRDELLETEELVGDEIIEVLQRRGRVRRRASDLDAETEPMIERLESTTQ